MNSQHESSRTGSPTRGAPGQIGITIAVGERRQAESSRIARCLRHALVTEPRSTSGSDRSPGAPTSQRHHASAERSSAGYRRSWGVEVNRSLAGLCVVALASPSVAATTRSACRRRSSSSRATPSAPASMTNSTRSSRRWGTLSPAPTSSCPSLRTLWCRTSVTRSMTSANSTRRGARRRGQPALRRRRRRDRRDRATDRGRPGSVLRVRRGSLRRRQRASHRDGTRRVRGRGLSVGQSSGSDQSATGPLRPSCDACDVSPAPSQQR